MTRLKENWYRLAIILLMLVALGDQPYAYYQFLRWATAIVSFYLAYNAYENHVTGWMWAFIIVGVLFNPIVPFHMKKESWQVYNLAVAVLYGVSLIGFKLKHER